MNAMYPEASQVSTIKEKESGTEKHDDIAAIDGLEQNAPMKNSACRFIKRS
jgi:hypothetical protein